MNKIIKIVLSVCVLLMMKSTMAMGMDDVRRPAMKLAIPEEAVYKRFLKGALVYRPTAGSDVGKIELPIARLANPLDATFDLSRCGDTGSRLSIATGYRKEKQDANDNKLEIWLTPRFLIEKNLSGSARHYEPIMETWDAASAPVGLFFNWGGWNDLGCFDYLTTQSYDTLHSKNLYAKWRGASNPHTPHTTPYLSSSRFHPEPFVYKPWEDDHCPYWYGADFTFRL